MAYERGRGRGRGRGDFERRDNSGALFENDRKESDKHPDFRGQVMVDGRNYWISGWWKKPKNGGPEYMSLAIERQDEQRRRSHDRDRGDEGRRGRGDERGDDRRDDDRRGREDRRGARDDRQDERRGRDDEGDYKGKKYDDEIPF